MSRIKCDRTNCEFNKESLCTTDVEIHEGGCATYKETESSKRSRFYYKEMEMKDIGSFVFVIKHDIYISLNTIIDIIIQDQGFLNQEIIVDTGYSNGLSNNNRFFYFEIVPNDKNKCGYDIYMKTNELTKKTKLFLSVKTREFFYNNQHLIDGSIWCREEKEMMKKTGFELLDYIQNKNK